MRDATARATVARILHDGWRSNTHHGQAPNHFAAHNRDRGQQELLPPFVRLGEYRISMVEGIEELPELENMFRQVCRLRGRDALIDHR
jgi:hypothetical protein